MKENFEQMSKRHTEEIEKLQKNCKHKKLSDWTEYMWAPGHFGSPVKTCLFCGKIIKSQGLDIRKYLVVGEKEIEVK